MLLNENHHAGILSAYFLALKGNFGNVGLAIFKKAEQFYGERRGRRMALRALRDGKQLNYAAYFEYGELISTKGAIDVEFDVGEGRVDECVIRCPWASEFRRLDCTECGEFYCKEIDAAVVRGFNPYLKYELVGNLYQNGCCRFIFQDDSIFPGLFQNLNPPTDAKRDFNFHCADVYQAYVHTVRSVMNQHHCRVIMEEVKGYLDKVYGQDLLSQIDNMLNYDFEIITAS